MAHISRWTTLPMAQSGGLEPRLRDILGRGLAKQRPVTRRLLIGIAATACAVAMPLAFIRPSFSARAGATSPESDVLRPQPGTWTVVTPLGSQITLVGVAQVAGRDGKWWSPDGEALSSAPLASTGHGADVTPEHPGFGLRVRRLFGRPQLRECSLRVTDPPYLPTSDPLERVGVYASEAVSSGVNEFPFHYTVMARPEIFGATDNSFSVNLGIDRWTTLGRADKSGATNCVAWYGGKRIVTNIAPFKEARDFRDSPRAWESASVVGQKQYMTVHSAIYTSYPPGSEFRIRVMGKHGKDFYVQQYRTISEGKRTRITASFKTGYRSDLKADDIREIVVQVRPVRTLTFENIASQPKETAE